MSSRYQKEWRRRKELAVAMVEDRLLTMAGRGEFVEMTPEELRALPKAESFRLCQESYDREVRPAIKEVRELFNRAMRGDAVAHDEIERQGLQVW